MKFRYTTVCFLLSMFIATLTHAQDIIINTNTDLPACPLTEVTLTATVGLTPDTIIWTPGNIIVSVTGPQGNQVVVSAASTMPVYATAVYADTTLSDTFELSLFPGSIEISQGDTALNCLDEEVTMLNAVISPGATITWSPAEGLSGTNTVNVSADPDSNTVYVATIVTPDGCILTDTVFVQVDSIQREYDITAVPGPMDPCMKYCPGTDVALFTQMTNFDDFPRTTFEWTPISSITTTDTLQNAAILTDVTTEYVRIAHHGACEERDTILIEVVDPAIPLSVSDTSVCPGMPVQVFLDPTDLTDIEWTADPMDAMQFISCDDCPNPRIEIGSIGEVIGGTFTFTVMGTKEECCPAMGSVTIQVILEQEPTVQVETCADIPVQIEINSNLTNIQWEDPAGNLSCGDCFNPTATVNTSQTFNYSALNEEMCTVIGSANVIVTPPQTVIEAVLNYCSGASIDLDISSLGLTNISWQAGPDVNLSCSDCDVATASPDPPLTYLVDFTARDADGCVVNGFFTLDPFVNDVIEINIDSTNTYAVGGFAPVTLTVEPVPNNLIVSWCFEGVPVPELSGSSVVVPVLREGDNLYSAKFVDSFGCAREIAVTVIGVLPIIQIPKAFKPRSMDDDNKVFRPFITNAEGSPADLIADFKIFNRWGELVYDNDDNDNGWDGQQDGEDAPAEVYIYLITIAYPDGSTELFKGDVTLLR